jgi:Fe-S-cluster containining protein
MTNMFPCSGCGACCRRVKQAVQHHNITDKNHPLYFPYRWDKSGACEHLGEDNKCKIYLKRPLLCNIDKYAEYIGADKKEFFALNIQACNQLMDSDGIPLHFRIK